MYIPNLNQMTDRAAIIEFMQRFSFATLISSNDHLPVATHLPFVVKDDGTAVTLLSHFAKANDQWKAIMDHDVLVIFSEPHAYISPENYEKELNVPTWNYIAVHCYGKVSIINKEEKVMDLLEHTINNYEPAYKQQWDGFSHEYKSGMAKGIIAFEVNVTTIQAKEKLSQNKTLNERKNIIDSLSKSNNSSETMIADYMKKAIP